MAALHVNSMDPRRPVLANSVTIASEVSGRIVDIRVRQNQSVKKGEILFIIDQSTYKAAVDSAEASVASNRAQMDLQQSNAARGHKLTKLSISAQECGRRGSELFSHRVRIAPLHLVEARLVNQALTLGEGRDQPSALVQHALIAQCAQRRLHAPHRALKSCIGV